MASQLPSGFVENPFVGAPLRPKPRKRQAEHLLQDCKRLCSVDIESPFTDLHDTIHRLLPFHLFHSEEGGEADLEETPDGQGKDLIWSRHEAWADMCLQKAGDFAIRSQAIHSRLQLLDKKMRSMKHARPEEELLLERLASQDVHDRYVAETKSAHAFQMMAQMTNPPGSSGKQAVSDAVMHGIPARQAAPMHVHNESGAHSLLGMAGGQPGTSPSLSGPVTSSVSGRMLLPVQSGMDHGFQPNIVVKGLIPGQKVGTRPALSPACTRPRASNAMPLSDVGLHSTVSRAFAASQSSEIECMLPGASKPAATNHGTTGGVPHGVIPRAMLPSVSGEICSIPRAYDSHTVDRSMLSGRGLLGGDSERLQHQDDRVPSEIGTPGIDIGTSRSSLAGSRVIADQDQSGVDKGKVIDVGVVGSGAQWKAWHTMGSQGGLR